MMHFWSVRNRASERTNANGANGRIPDDDDDGYILHAKEHNFGFGGGGLEEQEKEEDHQ